MVKEIQIGANKSIKFQSNGATPLFFKQIFKHDLLKELNGDGLEIAQDKIPELAFVMAKQAEKANMMDLNFDSYVAWLSEFEPLDLVLAGADIANVYISDSIPYEEPKKKKKGAVNA